MELKSKRDRLQVGLLLLPGLLVFALFTIYPIVKLLHMSFLQWDLGSMLHQKFIGLQNYIDVLSDETFRIAFANTSCVRSRSCLPFTVPAFLFIFTIHSVTEISVV